MFSGSDRGVSSGCQNWFGYHSNFLVCGKLEILTPLFDSVIQVLPQASLLLVVFHGFMESIAVIFD